MSNCDGQPLDFGKVVKHPQERITLRPDFFDQLADFWSPGEFYRQGDAVRPTVANGFCFVAEADGTADYREPRWKRSVDALTTDGSLTWRGVVATENAMDIITLAEAFPAAGLSLGADVTWTGSEMSVTIEGGSDGADYPVELVATTQRGERLVGVLEIEVRKNRKV